MLGGVLEREGLKLLLGETLFGVGAAEDLEDSGETELFDCCNCFFYYLFFYGLLGQTDFDLFFIICCLFCKGGTLY